MPTFSLPRLRSKSAPLASTRARIVATGVVSESVFRTPDRRLDGIVAGQYQGWTEKSTEVVRRREVPICAFPFIVNFGSKFRLIDPTRPALGPRILGTFVAGMYDSFVIVESRGESSCIQVNFTPTGARLFFQVPLWELSNMALGLDELYGDHSTRVVESLAEAGDWDRRFDMLDAWISMRIGSARPTRPEIQQAWRVMQQTPGRLEIGWLAKDVGWSHKHLIAQCRDQLGAAPKLLARVLRFQRAIERMGGCAPPPWIELALDCGYFDQSHMIREFQELAGCTPEQYLGLQLSHGGVSTELGTSSENPARR
jgi:AraC-like DNA-binding protein